MENVQVLMTAIISGIIMPVVQWVKSKLPDYPFVPFIINYGLSIGVAFGLRWIFKLEWDAQATIEFALAYIGTIANGVHIAVKTVEKVKNGGGQ